MALFTAHELVEALDPIACDGAEKNFSIEGVSTDTRTLEPGMLFVALRGERFDGHCFTQQAVERGAAALVLEVTRQHELPQHPVPTIWVRDTLGALGALARYHRRRFGIPVMAIAGAVGKTTTKDMTAHLLSAHGAVHKTPENWNNQVGVPLVLLGLRSYHTAAVIELGTNHPGEIEQLCRIVEPTHGLITTIAEEHLEFFGSLDGVEQEETALFRWLATSGGVACVNLDDLRLRRYHSMLPSVLTFGTTADAMLVASVRFEPQTLYPIVSLEWQGMRAEARIVQPGYAAALCAIAASAAAVSMGALLDVIAAQLAQYRPPPTHGYARMVVQSADGGMTILNDCYNANPASMRCALETLAAYPTNGRRLAVLGDMRELGAASPAEHRRILSFARERADALVLLGEDMHRAAIELGVPALLADDHARAAELVRQIGRPGDVVLVKGSRTLALEHVIALLGASTP
ncbi:MAG: UDP-N-acetylmuramoyl-tripeptide--D-alanyl-D-alanine ligase [Candidatus Kapaibacterium sp.]|nr:MAG: UDP-N-acetylmuramoyl-tripeptide--D-alanyl-D-alanine ligase [Candidatus Kapabacteria bacterium]